MAHDFCHKSPGAVNSLPGPRHRADSFDTNMFEHITQSRLLAFEHMGPYLQLPEQHKYGLFGHALVMYLSGVPGMSRGSVGSLFGRVLGTSLGGFVGYVGSLL